MDAIASISEREAYGPIAAVYRDIRQTLAAPTVNLVWRHMAALDGALLQVWPQIKPLYHNPVVRRLSAALRQPKALPELAVQAKQLGLAASVEPQQAVVIAAVLANYDETNPINLLTLMALRARLREQQELTVLPDHSDELGAPVAQPLPPLIAESDMSDSLGHMARRLEVLGTGLAMRPIVAGVPRHLAHWPSFLSVTLELLEAYEQPIAAAIEAVHSNAERWGRTLASEIQLEVSSLGDEGERVLAALDRFTAPDLIANYVVKVRVVRNALGATFGR